MTVQATPGTEVEATPPSAETSSLEQDYGDGPLIPAETPGPGDSLGTQGESGPVVEQGQEQQEEGAAKPGDEGAAKDDGDTGTPGPEEQKPPATTLTREEHETELAKVRSGMDRRASELEKRLTSAEEQLKQREQQYQQALGSQELQAKVIAYRDTIRDNFIARGHSEEDADSLANEQARIAQKAYQIEQERQQVIAENAQLRQQGRHYASRQTAIELAAEHGVPDDHMPLLLSAGGFTEAEQLQNMTSLAQALGSLTKTNQELQAARLTEVPAGGDENKVDSGGGASGGLTDDQKMADPNTPLAEIEEILERRGDHPFR